MHSPEHSPLGASSADRWMNCPGSVAFVATLPRQPETADMMAGTAAHTVAQLCLGNGRDADSYIGDVIDGTRHEFTDDDAAAVQTYLDHCRELTRDGRAAQVAIEKRFKLAAFDPMLWGRNDYSAIVPVERCLHVVDYKHGVGTLVRPEENRQLKYYALGALLEGGADVERVAITVAQPRSYQSGEPIRTWQTTPDALIEFGFELAAAAAATRAPDAPLVCGDWCDTCPGAGACSALYESALSAAGLSADAPHAEPAPPAAMSAAELGARLETADRLALWLRAVRSFAYAEAMRGRAPEGHKLVAKRGRRAFADGTAAAVAALDTFDTLGVADVFESKPISPAKLEKLVGKKVAAGFIKGHLAQPTAGLTLVPLSDKRNAEMPPQLSELEPINLPDEVNDYD